MRENFELIALACGTKHRRENTEIKDMHAEVLARRALNRWLVDTQYKGDEIRRFHLYVSSAPCGNACVRRWATAKKEISVTDEEAFSLSHDKLSLHAIKEGQISLTVKKEGEGANPDFLPTGVACFEPNKILSCSDKLSLFNAVGWTKLCLRDRIPRVDISSMSIGRKFARSHAQRALCCRLQGAKIAELKHPVLLCTSVKFDDSSREDDGDFSEDVFMWCATRDVERIDYRTGLTTAGNRSSFSTAALQDAAQVLPLSFPTHREDSEQLKKKAREYLERYSV